MSPLMKICALLAVLLPASLVLAHHGVARYDMNTVLTLEGTVEEWSFRNPHSGLILAVEGEDGTEIWDIEGAPPRWMSNQGFTPDSLHAGERVTITYHPVRSPAREGILMHVDRNNGERLSVNRPRRLGGP